MGLRSISEPTRVAQACVSGPSARRLVAALGRPLLVAATLALAFAFGVVTPVADAAEGPPRRIISLVPAVVEALYALELGERVVGVGNYSVWPPEVTSKPRLGGLFDPSLEGIVALAPDLVILAPSQGDLGARLAQFRIQTLVVRTEDVADVEAMFLALGERAGIEAGPFVARFRNELAPRQPPIPLRVALLIGRQPGALADLLVAGEGTYLDDLLRRLGATNVFADARLRYPAVSPEEILARNPDVIVEVHAAALDQAARANLTADWQRFPSLRAVATGRVRVVAGDYTMLPGPRLPELYRALEHALVDPAAGHP